MSQMNRTPAPRGPQVARQARPTAAQSASPGGVSHPGGASRPSGASRPGMPRRSARARRGGGGWRDVARIAAGGLIVALLALLLQARWPNGFPLRKSGAQAADGAVAAISEIHTGGPLRINEIMTSNRRTLADGEGNSPDWVELMNASDEALNLRGYALAKSESGTGVLTLPEQTLDSGECALVLADSRLRAEAGEALHAPFRLSSSGDTLMLFNPSGTAVDTVNIPALNADVSYVRADRGAWETSSEPTPGLPNTPESYRLLSEPSGDSPVLLSEIVASNSTALADESGAYYDYIELHNRSNETVNLAGWCLSDDAKEARKWSFPSVEIAPDAYLIVYASGLDRRDDPAALHTNFSLSSEGEQVALTDAQGRMMDRVDFGLLKSNAAWSLGSDGVWKSGKPSPGAANP